MWILLNDHVIVLFRVGCVCHCGDIYWTVNLLTVVIVRDREIFWAQSKMVLNWLSRSSLAVAVEAPHSHREQLLPQEVLHLLRKLLKRRRKRRKPRRRRVTTTWVSPSSIRRSLGFVSFTIFQNDRISLWGDVYYNLVLCRGLYQSKAWCSLSWNCHEAYMGWCWWMYHLSHILTTALSCTKNDVPQYLEGCAVSHVKI